MISSTRILLWLLIFASPGSAAEISIPSQAATAGQLIASSVMLSTEDNQLSGVQFDLEWDAGQGVQIVAGSGLVKSGKLLYSAQLTPRKIRVLIIGMDQVRLTDGELLRLFIAVGPEIGSSQLKLTNLLGASPGGDAVAVRGSSATIRVDGGAPVSTLLQESVLNAASLQAGPIAPGEIVTLLGNFGLTAESAAGVTASVNGTSATVLYGSGNQINMVVPWGLDIARQSAALMIRSLDKPLAQVSVSTAAASPALFTQIGTGIGPGAVLNEDYTPNSSSNPAAPGSIVMMYGTGFGALNPPTSDGAPGMLSATALPVTALIGGVPATVLYAGAAPGLAAGVVQINVRIPEGISSKTGAPIALLVGAFATQSGVSIALR